MVLVDTSVWIDFFQAPQRPTAVTLTALIRDHNRVVLCGIVLQEILQGIREQRSYERVRESLLRFPFLETDRDTWLQAAALYRELRRDGITLPPVDVTLAALAMQHSVPILTRDEHFKAVAERSALRLFE